MRLGEIIKEYRETHSITQQQFADNAKVSKAYISMMENNKTGRSNTEAVPSIETYERIAKALNMSLHELCELAREQRVPSKDELKTAMASAIRIPVYGTVATGMPLESIEDVVGYEELPSSMASMGEYFALRIKGQSMEPKMSSGDVVIVRRQESVESGELGIVLVNGNEAACRRVIYNDIGIILVPLNSAFSPMAYTKKDMKNLPIKIIGKVIELRAKFN